ncbi:hypothetical protein CAEBREN_19253 [Caenorhabditis brenneri]|uniref:Uncharacterized protein n=1 Tax=Caenorhabditis brenneri TaxID=135651 RepID=G0MFZ7_CAEBE|nr:hypothetical protein CAEBREN_19253 [Caenorhabditis brenneri]
MSDTSEEDDFQEEEVEEEEDRGFVELMPDGFPRYYMKKPKGEWWEYARPMSPEEAWAKEKLDKETDGETLWRWAKTFMFILAMKTIDSFFVMIFIHILPFVVRIWLTTRVFIDRNRCYKKLSYVKPTYSLPILWYIVEKSFIPVMPVVILKIFFSFDDLFPGPMFRNKGYQEWHMWVKEEVYPSLSYNPLSVWSVYRHYCM